MKFKRKNSEFEQQGNNYSRPQIEFVNQQYPPNNPNGYNNNPNNFQPQQIYYPQNNPQQPVNNNPNSNISSNNENFGPAAIKVIRKEKFYHIIAFFFWLLLFLTASATAIIFYLISQKIIGSIKYIEYFEKNVIGWYVLLGIIGFPSFIGCIWNLFQINSWKATAKKLKLNNRYDDASLAFKFGDVYKKQVLRNTNVKWLFISTVTYYVIFLGIIYGFKDVVIDIDWTNFKFFLDIGARLRNVFGDITTFVLINSGVLAGIIVITTIYIVFNKKYIMKLRDFLGVNSNETVENVEKRRISRNKALRRIYIFSLLLTIILPIFITGILILRFFRRKRAK